MAPPSPRPGATPFTSGSDVERLLDDQEWLLKLARSLLGDEQAAEDVVQETRLAEWLHPPRDAGTARHWLARVARRFALRRRALSAGQARREELAAQTEAQPPTDELVARVQMQRSVADAVLLLDEPYRAVVLLRFFDGLPPREIAARLAVPVETVRTRLKRALEKLRVRLDGEFGAREAWAGLLLPWLTTGTVTMSVTAKVAGVVVAAGLSLLAWSVWQQEPARVDPMKSGADGSVNGPAVATTSSQSPAPEPARVALTEAQRAEESPPVAAESASGPHIWPQLKFVTVIRAQRDGTPLADAEFTLEWHSTYDLDDKQTRTTKSDAKGRVELTVGPICGLPVDYTVLHPGFARSTGQLRNLVHGADGVVRLEEVMLRPGARVSGHVVRARDGLLIGGAELRLCNLGQSSFMPNQARPVGRSRRDGSFELAERVVAGQSDPITLFAITDEGLGWTLFEVPADREQLADVDVRIEPAARLRVSVQDPDGTPLPGAGIRLEPHFAPVGPGAWWGHTHSMWFGDDSRLTSLFVTETDAQGIATLARLPVGAPHELLKRARIDGPFDTYDLIAAREGFDQFTQDGLRLQQGQETMLELRLAPSRSYDLVGHVRDVRGKPIAGATLVQRTNDRKTASDEAGAYRFDHMSSLGESIGLQVSAPGFARREIWTEPAKLAAEQAAAADAAPPAEIVLDLVLDDAFPILGRVVDDHAVPIAGLQVWLTRDENDAPKRREVFSDRWTTDAEGRFTITDALEGDWFLHVETPVPRDEWEPPVPMPVEGGDEEVTVTLKRRLGSHASLVAEIVDATNGAPAEIKQAFVVPAHDDVRSSVGQSECTPGLVTVKGLRPGVWRLDVSLVNGGRGLQEFEVQGPDEEVHLRVEVGPLATVEGLVVLDAAVQTAATQPLEKMWIHFWPNSEGHMLDDQGAFVAGLTDGCARVDAHGRFRIGRITPGRRYRINVGDWTLFDEQYFVARSGESVKIEFHPRPAGKLQFLQGESLPQGVLTAWIVRGDEPWIRVGWNPEPKEKEPFGTVFSLPGPLRWRAEFLPQTDIASDLPARVVEGEATVVAGETARIEVRGFH